MKLVLDCSVSLGFFRRSQATPYSDAVLATAPTAQWHVPSLWRSEFVNALVSLRRRKLADAAWCRLTLRDVAQLPLHLESNSPALDELHKLAEAHDLSAYDAEYLACAMRLDIPLATQDEALARAAKKQRLLFVPAAS